MKRVGVAAAALIGFLAIPAAAAVTSQQGTEPALAIEQVSIGAPDNRMIIAILRPAAPDSNASADARDRRLPLIVISHGTGAGPIAHIDTAEALTAAGFIVAAPMHRGDNFQDDSKVGRAEWLASRSRDVSNVIDYMIGEYSGRAEVDQEAVGIFGFSAGATTALVSAGGIPDLARIAPHCAAQMEFVCNIVATPSESAGPTPPLTHDRRVVAAVVAAPGLGFTFEPSGLDAVRIPVQLWAGGSDQIVPYATNTGVVRRLLPGPVDFHTVDNAGHLSFLAPCGPENAAHEICRDNPGFDRAAFHRDFNRSVVDFFRSHLTHSNRRADAASR